MESLMRIARISVLPVLTLILLLVAALPAAAADIRVDDNCSLRDAISSANRDSSRGGCEAGDGDDVIIIKRDSRPGAGQLPRIRTTIFIEGLGNTLSIDNNHSVFKIQDGKLTVRHLEVVYWDNTRERKSFEVYNGSLTLIDVTVDNCEVGVFQNDGHTSLQGNTDICGLPRDQLVTGYGTSSINLPVPLPPDTCGALPGAGAAVSATFGHQSGVQCRPLDGSGIGIQSIIDAGFIAAVDVWGYVEQGVEICFPQLGSITFLDAAMSPRTPATIDSYSRGNSTCTYLTRAGSVILMPGAPTGVAQPAVSQPTVSGPAVVDQPVTTLVSGRVEPGCPLVATGHLKHLAAPKSEAEILGYITRGTTMTVVSRVLGWYQVSHGGQTGWVGGKYTAGTGQC